jgi:effector-binding domain-containing protein
MEYQCEIREMSAQTTLCVRVRAKAQDLPQVMGRWFGEIGQYLVAMRQPPAGMPYCGYLAVDGEQMDVVIGFPVRERLPGKGDIQPGSLPGGRMAAVTHYGPYDTLEAAYHALTAYVQAQGLVPTGVWYEFYMNDPHKVAPEQVQTLVLMPLQ